jgi:hypothetical protein
MSTTELPNDGPGVKYTLIVYLVRIIRLNDDTSRRLFLEA